MRKLAGFIWVVALAAPKLADAQTLTEALTQAYIHSPILAGARAGQRALDETLPQAVALNRPSVELDAAKALAFTRTNGIATLSGPSYQSRPTIMDLHVVQPIWRGGRADSEEDAAQKQIQSGRAQLRLTEEAVLAEAITQYANLYAQQRILALAQRQEALLKSALTTAEAESGTPKITPIGVAQTEAAYHHQQNQRAAAEDQLGIFTARYQQQTGRAPGTLPPPSALPPPPDNRADALTLAQEKSAAIEAAGLDLAAAEDAIETSQRALLPTISLIGDVGYQTEGETIHSRVITEQVAAQISFPLYDGGVLASEARAAEAVKAQRQTALDAARAAGLADAAEAWDRYAANRKSHAALSAEIAAQARAVAAIQTDPNPDPRHIPDLVSQQQAYYDAEISGLLQERDGLVIQAQLLRAIGGLSAEALGVRVKRDEP